VGEGETAAAPVWQAIEMVCFVFFCVELLAKVCVHRLHYFLGRDMWWNWFDMILVVTSIGDLTLKQGNYTFIRVMRVMRTVKVLRIFRLMRFLADLRLILNSILGSMLSLFWSIVMMGLFFYVFTLMFLNQVAAALEEQGASLTDPDWEVLGNTFGSVGIGMLSLYKSSFGGDDWSKFYEALEKAGPWAQALFLFFVAFTQIAILNILTGIFLDHAMKCAEPDKDSAYLEKAQQQHDEMKLLHEICADLDLDQSGTISCHEFHAFLHKEGSPLRKRFFEIGLRPAETERFFDILSATSGSKSVAIQDFVHGVTKLRGGASSLDMQALSFQAKVMHTKIDTIWKHVCDQHRCDSLYFVL
jgi:voltage-gated sodium channel